MSFAFAASTIFNFDSYCIKVDFLIVKKYRKESFEDSFVKTLIRAGILTILDIM